MCSCIFVGWWFSRTANWFFACAFVMSSMHIKVIVLSSVSCSSRWKCGWWQLVKWWFKRRDWNIKKRVFSAVVVFLSSIWEFFFLSELSCVSIYFLDLFFFMEIKFVVVEKSFLYFNTHSHLVGFNRENFYYCVWLKVFERTKVSFWSLKRITIELFSRSFRVKF